MISGRLLASSGLAAAAFVAGLWLAPSDRSPEPERPPVAERTTIVRAGAPADPAITRQMIREAVRAELGASREDAPVAQPAEPETEPDADRQADLDERRGRIDAVISRARGAGRWTDTDAATVREASRAMPGDEVVAVHRELMQAVVAGELTVELEGPLL